MDLATRAYNHNFHIDPICRSLLDDDFYKLLMLQLIWKKYKDVKVKFGIKNRTTDVKLAKIIPRQELVAQLDYAKKLRFTEMELIWLQGQTFYGVKGIFKPEFVDFLRNLQLPDYELTEENDQYVLNFEGKWCEVSLWEIHALEIINTLKNRFLTINFSRLDFDVLYSNMKVKLWNKLHKIKESGAGIVDFGTRRRWDFLWQEWAILAAKDVLGNKFGGTSNSFLAMKHSIEAKGTNAHELPMVYAAMAKSDEELKQSQYNVLKDWMEMYDGNLLIALPDTFGSTQFFRDAPNFFFEKFKGIRWDSKDPRIAGENDIAMWKEHGIDPATRIGIASDGLDVDDIVELQKQYAGRLGIGFGWGTKLTNDTVGCSPRNDVVLKPISLVCKATWVKSPDMEDWRATVKLSDNPLKAMSSDQNELRRYSEVFGLEGMEQKIVTV